jgi:hypothetical protein
MHITERIEEKLPDISVKEQTDVYCFLYDLQKTPYFDDILEQYRKWDSLSVDINKCFSRLGNSTTGCIARTYQRSQYFNDALQDKIDIALKQIPNLNMEESLADMGLLTGYAGEGMLRLTEYRQMNNSWIFLL